MFTPSSHDVRRFFCEALRKRRAGEILTPMDAIAADWIEQHPEYHDELGNAEEAVARDYAVEGGKPNPFLHLSMHLSITEQVAANATKTRQRQQQGRGRGRGQQGRRRCGRQFQAGVGAARSDAQGVMPASSAEATM